MKSPYIRDLEPDKVIHTTFLVQHKEIRQKKSGEPYLSLMLADRTGELEAKMWDNVSEIMDTFDRDDFVKVKGLFQIFHNRPQLAVHKMQRVDEREIDFTDYFPASERNPEEMMAELRGIIAGIGNAHLRGLLEAIFAEEDVVKRYKLAPAAKQIHHAYLGGLIEHVLSLCGLCRLTSSHYTSLDADLLITGAILHDIGKIYELSYDRGFGYTTEGQLVGHMSIAIRMIGEKLRVLPDFPPKLRTLLEHMILSHHGKLEFGSPKVPQFPEALMLHYLDDLDSKMECMRAIAARDSRLPGDFTGYSASMERSVLKKARYLEALPSKEESKPAVAAVVSTPKPAEPAQHEQTQLEAVMEKFNSHRPTPVR